MTAGATSASSLIALDVSDTRKLRTLPLDDAVKRRFSPAVATNCSAFTSPACGASATWLSSHTRASFSLDSSSP